jgi:hypothetical protein
VKKTAVTSSPSPILGVGVTQGSDRVEALAQAADLLGTMVANYMAEGWDLPEPSPARRRPLMRFAHRWGQER